MKIKKETVLGSTILFDHLPIKVTCNSKSSSLKIAKKQLTLILLVFCLSGFTQDLKFFTNNGKTEVKQGNCNIKDLIVKVPIPPNAASYDRVRFWVFVSPNRNTNTYAAYHCNWEKGALAGKKEITIVLKNETGENEFYQGEYAKDYGRAPLGSPSALNINKPCNDVERVDQIYNLSFELEGMKYLRDDNVGVGHYQKEPIYQLSILKKWHNIFPYDYGKVDPAYFSEDKLFSVKKTYDNPTELSTSGNEIKVSMANGLMKIEHIPSTTMSLEEMKLDIIKAIKKATLASIKSSEEPKSWSLEFCYPCYSKKLKKSTFEEYDNAMAIECAQPADWKPVKIDGKDGFVFSTNRGLKSANYDWNFEAQKPELRDDGKIHWVSLFVFLVEHKGQVFVGLGTNGYVGSPEFMPKFYNDVMESFKLY